MATLVAAALTLVHIGQKSLWRDEGYTVSSVLRPWPSLWHLLWYTETNGFLYQIGQKLWSGFSDGQTWMRSFSALATIATVPVVAALAGRLFDRRVAMIAPFLFVLNGSVVTFGQLARGYAWSTLLASAATLAFVTLVDRPDRRVTMLWVLAVIGLAGVHVIAALLLLAAQVVALAGRPREVRPWRRIALGALIALTVTGAIGLRVATHDEDQGLLKLGLGLYHDTLMVLSGRGGVAGIVAFGLLGAVFLAGTWRAWRAHGRSIEFWPHALVLSCAALPPAALAVLSFIHPVLLGRYLLFCLPAFSIGAAAGAVALFDRLRAAGTRAGLLAVLSSVAGMVVLGGLVRGVAYWHAGGGVEDWRGAARLVEEQSKAGDRVVFADDWIRLFFEYYRTHPAPTAVESTPLFPAAPWGNFRTENVTYSSFTDADLSRLGTDAPRLWAVLGRDHTDVSRAHASLDRLGGAYRLTRSWVLSDFIEVYLYTGRS